MIIKPLKVIHKSCLCHETYKNRKHFHIIFLNENYSHPSGRKGVTGDYRQCKPQFIANTLDCVDVINMLPCYLLIFSDIIYPAPESLSPWWPTNRTFCGEQHKTNQTATWQLATCEENGFLLSSQTCTQPCLAVAVNSQSPLSELQWHHCRGETICCCCPPEAPFNHPLPIHTFNDSRGNLETADPNSDTVQHDYWCQSVSRPLSDSQELLSALMNPINYLETRFN